MLKKLGSSRSCEESVCVDKDTSICENENENVKEIIGKEIVLMSPVHYIHSRIVSMLFSIISRKLGNNSNCIAFTDTVAYDLSDLKSELGGKGKFVSPDVSVVCKPKFKGSRIATYPILIVEVLSPSTASRDLTLKKDLYAQMGVKDYLIVSRDGIVNHYTLVDGKYSNVRDIVPGDSFISSINPSIELSYDEIFGDIFTNELFSEDL